MNLILKLMGFIGIAGCLFLIVNGVVVWESIVGLIMSAGALLYLFKEDEYYAWLKQRHINRYYCRLESDHFYFPSGYYFRPSSLKRSKQLPFSKIQEIRINTHPISVLINDNELIFLLGIKSEVILSHPELSMKVKEENDNWSLLCEAFLDTELSEAEQLYNTKQLEKYGIPKDEQFAIKKRLNWRFLLRTYVTWEWVYYGQYDVLTELWPLTEKKYWWTMDVALRTKTNKKHTG